MSTIGTINFTRAERDLIMFAINSYGDGQHPLAVPSTFPFFERDYVKECVIRAKAAHRGLVDFQRIVCEDVLLKLQIAK